MNFLQISTNSKIVIYTNLYPYFLSTIIISIFIKTTMKQFYNFCILSLLFVTNSTNASDPLNRFLNPIYMSTNHIEDRKPDQASLFRLINAIRRNQFETVEDILKANPEFNLNNFLYGQSPLMAAFAVQPINTEIVKLLSNYKADATSLKDAGLIKRFQEIIKLNETVTATSSSEENLDKTISEPIVYYGETRTQAATSHHTKSEYEPAALVDYFSGLSDLNGLSSCDDDDEY